VAAASGEDHALLPDESVPTRDAAWTARKWTEDRQEHFTAVNQERGQVTRRGRLRQRRPCAALSETSSTTAAHTRLRNHPADITAARCWPYRIPNYRVRFRDLYQRDSDVALPRRGPPHACFVMERTLDAIAADLGLDRIEVRRRNSSRPATFLTPSASRGRTATRSSTTAADYPPARARDREARPEAAGDDIAWGSGLRRRHGRRTYEGRMCRSWSRQGRRGDGHTEPGQAHATVWAQVVADELGVDVGDVEVTSGDTAVSVGVGPLPLAARSPRATHACRARMVADKARQIARPPGGGVEDLELVADACGQGLAGPWHSSGGVAVLSNPVRYAFGGGTKRDAVHRETARGATLATASSLGWRRPLLQPARFDVASDATRICARGSEDLSPRILNTSSSTTAAGDQPSGPAGQIEGGVAQASAARSTSGSLTTATASSQRVLHGILMPYSTRSTIEIDHIETPSPLNP